MTAGSRWVPLGVPSGRRAIACWTAAEGVAVAIVDAADEMATRAAGALACPGWAKLPGVTVRVRVERSRSRGSGSGSVPASPFSRTPVTGC